MIKSARQLLAAVLIKNAAQAPSKPEQLLQAYAAQGRHPKDRALGWALGTAAGGPLAGAVTGQAFNFTGDLARKYISNNVTPLGYSAKTVQRELTPRSFAHVWNTSVGDQPVVESGVVPETRRELFRAGLGVGTDAERKYITPNQDGSYRFSDLFHNKYPAEVARFGLQPTSEQYLRAVLGGYQLRRDETGHHVQDVWDFDLHPNEAAALKQGTVPWALGQKQVASPAAAEWTKAARLRQFLNSVIMEKPARIKDTIPSTVAPTNAASEK